MRKLLILIALMMGTVSGAAVAGDVGVSVTFSTREAAVIRAWYRDHGSQPVHGKGRNKLPPGIAKNLQRGKSLPPGIAKRALPSALVSSLPPVRHGYERIIVDGKILLVEVATQVVHDILTDVLLR